MEKSFNMDHIFNFVKTLVELGGTHYVDGNNIILNSNDNTPIGVTVNIAGKDVHRPIAVFQEGMSIGEYVPLNPFVELLGRHDENDWFLKLLQVLPGVIIYQTLFKMQEHATSDKDVGFKASKNLSKFIGRIDARFAKELGKIRPLEICHIYYDRKTHIAQLQSDICDAEFEKEIGSKVRKSSINLIREIVKAMLKVEDCPEEIQHTATLIGCARFDAEAHVLIDVIDRIDEFVEPLLDISLHAEELKEHLTKLEAYQKAMAFLTSSAAPSATSTGAGPMTSAKKTTTSGGTVPWKSSMGVSGAPASIDLSRCTPIGGVKSPYFNGGSGVTLGGVTVAGGSGGVRSPYFQGTAFAAAGTRDDVTVLQRGRSYTVC